MELGINPRAMRRTLIALLALLSASLLGWAEASSAPPTVVRFSYWADHEENTNMWQRFSDAFERAHPGVRIKREWYAGDYGRKLQLVLISNTAADIILMDDEVYPSYAVRGYLEDLRPYIERESDDIERLLAADLRYSETPVSERDPDFDRQLLPTALDSFNYRGFVGGLPYAGFAVVMYYNKDLFDQSQIPYPSKDWTWADFRTIARRLTKDTDGDGRIDQFGTNLTFDFLGLEPILWSFGADVLNKDASRCVLDSPRALEAMQVLFDMKYTDHSVAWSGEMEGFSGEVQLLTGRLGMVAGASYTLPALNVVTEGMRWDVAPMPSGPYGDRHTRVTWNGISINARSSREQKEIAWQYIKYLLSEEVQAVIGNMQRGLPARRAQALANYVNSRTPATEEIVVAATDYGKVTPITPRYNELYDAMASEFNSLNVAEITGATLETAVARVVPKVNRVLDKELADWKDAQAGQGTEGHATRGAAKAVGLACLAVFGAAVALLLMPGVRANLGLELALARRMFRSKRARASAVNGILFASPWLLGFCIFAAFPIIFSIVLSLCEWNPYEPLEKVRFIGIDNFRRALSSDPVTGDPLVFKALYNTFYYALFSVPLGLSVSLGLALLLNQKVRGIAVFRTIFYLPSIIAGVATAILWVYILNPHFGPLNGAIRIVNSLLDRSIVLSFVHLPEPMWLGDPQWAKPGLILMSLWGAGGAGMLIFLAGLQGVPEQLYEVAELDGAGRWRKFRHITIPMLTPTIYFNLVMGIIGALQVFMQAYVMTDGLGGVNQTLLFYVFHLYNKAFVEYAMGYASALAWILFVIILSLTLLLVKSSGRWVYYEGEQSNK